MEFDIKELTGNIFSNYVGPDFPTWFKNNKQKYILPSLKGIGRDLLLGKPYFQVLKVAYKGEQFVFPNEPLISLSLAKTIVETATVGKERKGTVKEYICTEDYQLSIKGVCFNTESMDEFPTDQVQVLQRLFEINDSVEILSNPFLLLFDIKNLVFKSIEWQEMAGQQGLQIYNITAVSDADFYADLAEKDKLNVLK